MKKILFTLLITVFLYGCEKVVTMTGGTTVSLITVNDPVMFKKSVILYNESDYLIKTPLDTFLLGYPFFDGWGYDDMKAKATADGKIKDILIVSDYLKYRSDSIFTLAWYLENGKCFMLDKRYDKSIINVLVKKYAEGKPMESFGGRRFYIKNELFLETVDMISK